MSTNILLMVMTCLLIINKIQGAPHLVFLNITTTDTDYDECISEAEALSEYEQPVVVTCFGQCADGPHSVDYYTPGYLYWPHIKYGSCDGLTCESSYKKRCTPLLSRQRSQTVCVYKCDMYGCTFTGTQTIVYDDHLLCNCECGVVGECTWGYTWEPQQCKCIKEPCDPEFPTKYNHHDCVLIHINQYKKRQLNQARD